MSDGEEKDGVPSWAIRDYNEQVKNIERVAVVTLALYEKLSELIDTSYMSDEVEELYKWMGDEQ